MDSGFRLRAACTGLLVVGCGACTMPAAPRSGLARSGAAGRVHVVNQPLPLAPDGATAGLHTDAVSLPPLAHFTYVAAVDAPTNPATGRTVQATNFAFDGRYAYVVYNTAGDEVAGAFEVVDLSDTTAPKVLASLVSTDAEFADVVVVGSYAYAVGEVANGTSAALRVFDVSVPAAPRALGTVALDGGYATSITVDGKRAYVTTGVTGGLVPVDLSVPEFPTVAATVPLPNALYVVHEGGESYVLGGADATSVYGAPDGKALAPVVGISSSSVAAPGRMATLGDYLVTNAGTTGLTVVDPTHGTFVSQTAMPGLGNGIDVGGSFAFLAQGDQGTHVVDLTTPTAPRPMGHFQFPDAPGSTNEVRYGKATGGPYVFVGDGAGGFRIVGFSTQDDPNQRAAVPFAATGDFLGVRNPSGGYDSLFLQGANLSIAYPGSWPQDIAANYDQYVAWLGQMGAMGANVVRLYELHHPHFYWALAAYNRAHPTAPIYLVQGILLTDTPVANDLYSIASTYDLAVQQSIDAVHGAANLTGGVGRATGDFTQDVSPWTIAYVLGREVSALEAITTAHAHADVTSFTGKHLVLPNGNPNEAFWTARLDGLIDYERAHYGSERPAGALNIPELDPLGHPLTPRESRVDLANLQKVDAPAGFFATFDVYPYYPDFILTQVEYQNAYDTLGPDPYLGYLQALKEHYAGIPLVVAEYGVPSSWGDAHFGADGMNHGGLDEATQGADIARMLGNIHAAGAAGGIQFGWLDEWWKGTWICTPQVFPETRYPLWHNVVCPEQNFGVLAWEPPVADFTQWAPVPGAGAVTMVSAASSNDYFHVRVALDAPVSAAQPLVVAFDTYADDRGETLLPNGVRATRRSELALTIDGSALSQLYVMKNYDLSGLWNASPLVPGAYQSVASDAGAWNPVVWYNSAPANLGQLRTRLASAPESSMDAVILDGTTVDIRVPWMLLQFSDPTTLTVVDGTTTAAVQTSVTAGVAVVASFGGSLVETGRFAWSRWDVAPLTTLRVKDSYAPMAAQMQAIGGKP